MNIQDEVIEIIRGILKIDPALVAIDTKMEDLQEWDSMRNVMILSTLESHFDLMFPEDDIFDLVSVRATMTSRTRRPFRTSSTRVWRRSNWKSFDCSVVRRVS